MTTLHSIACISMLAASLCADPVVHVSPAGSDLTGDGSASSPFRTLDHALGVVDPGGVIRLFDGSYPAAATIPMPVTLEAIGPGHPILGPRPDPGAVLTLANASDVVLRGLWFRGATTQIGVRALGACDRMVVEDCDFADFGGDAVQITGSPTANPRLSRCRFARLAGAIPPSGVRCDGTTDLLVEDCAFADADLGIVLVASPRAVIRRSSFVDLRHSALLAIASTDLALSDARISRSAQLPTPLSSLSPSDERGAISLVGLSHRATLSRILVEDCGGYLGAAAAYGLYDGLFGIAIADSDDVHLDGCSLHRNEFGGLAVVGASTGCHAHDCSFVGNGWKNGALADIALHASVPAFDAASCFWGLPGGPQFDGQGPGNGIGGGALIQLAPIAMQPVTTSPATSIVAETSVAGPLRGRAIRIADVDGDLLDDVLVVADLAQELVVYRETPSGLATAIHVPLTGTPVSLATADFDGDGDLDVAVVDESADRIRILAGDGTGSFTPQSTSSTARRPLRIRTADLDGQPGSDLVVACAGDLFAPGGVDLFLGDGHGAFTRTSLTGAVQPTDVELVDLNADGRLDVVAYDTDRAGPGLRIWRNLGGGSFSAMSVASTDLGPVIDATLARIDLDGLGDRDLAVARFTFLAAPATTTIELFRNSGGGSLLGPTAVDIVLGPAEMASSDVGDRGRARLVVALPALGEVRAYGPFEPAPTPFAPYHETLFDHDYPQAVALGELTGDAADDVVVSDASSGELSIWRGRIPAFVTRFGYGCPGTLGVPRALWRSLPELGATSFGISVELGSPLSAGVLLISVLPAAIPIASGCSLLVQPNPFAVVAGCDATGAASIPLGVPLDRGLLRGELFVQWWLLDPNGAAFGALSSSDGLRIHVGG
ncbi:MAG: FG-GAP-like repeat-containing protein [Planctomycetota bacterium]